MEWPEAKKPSVVATFSFARMALWLTLEDDAVPRSMWARDYDLKRLVVEDMESRSSISSYRVP